MIERICEQCGKMFFVKPYVPQRGGGRFCSRRCHYDSEITKVERTCLKCHKPFLIIWSRKGSKFCSRKCYQQARNPKVERVCQQCGRGFYAWSRDIERSGAKYCSIECYKQARRKQLERTCQQCGKTFLARNYQVKIGEGKFCSVSCYRLSRSRRRLVERTCPICGKQFLTQLSRARLFCSQQCFSIDCRRRHHTAEAIQKIAETSKGRHPSKETRQKQSKIVRELWKQIKYIEAHRTASKKLWQDPEYVHKTLAGMAQKPTYPEKRLDNILRENLPAFQYNGDFRLGFMIAGLIPDFVNVNGKKELIEVFGDYWHSEQVIGDAWHRSELGRIMSYNSLGYQCLVIWEHELKELSEQEIVDKIKTFFTPPSRVLTEKRRRL